MRKKILMSVVVLAAMTMVQGCAVFYTTDMTDANGSKDREFGLFGGCLPLWHYRNVRSAAPIVPMQSGGGVQQVH
jgi:hypothetical protein